MSNNYREKNQERNEAMDSFNISKEELMNCFGSQIASQSSKSNYDYNNQNNEINNQSPENSPKINLDISKNGLNKDDVLRNICHGFIDMFFSQKEELKGIKEEIKKLQNIMINNNNSNNMNNANNGNLNYINNNNRLPGNKINKNNNQKSGNYNINLYNNNNFENNDNYNYNQRNSKRNPFINSNNNLNIFENQNNSNKRYIPILSNPHKSRSKSPNIISNPKSVVPETVPEAEEEYESTATRKQKRDDSQKKQENKEIIKNNFEDPFFSGNSKENPEINLADIKDDEFDDVLRGVKNNKMKNKMLMNDPFKKSSELKKRQNLEEKENQQINANENENKEKNDDSYIDIENDNDKIKDNNLGMINLDLDEMQSDFMAGGKKVTVKLNDNVRKKISKEMNSLDEPVNILEELSRNKKPSNIFHNNSKLSCTDSLLSKNKGIDSKSINNSKTIKMITSKMKPSKRNYNTMAANSKRIFEKENIEKKEEERNGSSVKERGGFIKKLKKFGHSNDYNNLIINLNNNKSNPNSNNNSQNIKITTHKKINKNKKYMFTTISTCEFYCLCQKQNYLDNTEINLIENSKCNICKNSGIININNFMKGFYYYILNDANNFPEIKTSEGVFPLLKEDFKDINEKDSDYNTKKELEQFFNYQFNFHTYDKYIKISREKENNSEFQIENIIEDIYSKLVNKYILCYVKARRSFLTEVAEKDSNLGYCNICLLLMNISNNPDPSIGDKVIEFSDGFKSCFATIDSKDPINNLMSDRYMILHNWMNVQIGMSKVVHISEDFKLYIKIYYNSISPFEKIDNNDINYGPLMDERKLLLKNITELSNDGGEISSIKVILFKKYGSFVFNHTKKQRFSMRKFQDESMKISESGEKKNYNRIITDSDEKNNNNNNDIKDPDLVFYYFKAIAMDYEIYNLMKKGENNNKNIENLLKRKYIIEFSGKNEELFENISDQKMYQLMFLNLESKNNANNNKKYYNKNNQENNIIIRFNDKSQINEIPQNINYKTEKAYTDTMELIQDTLNLTNNIDIGKIFVESEEKNKPLDCSTHINNEYCINGIYCGYAEKHRSGYASDNNNEQNEGNNEEEKLDKYIILSLGISKFALIKIHQDDFFPFDLKQSSNNNKMCTCSDIIFNEIVYFDNDNNQPKITGNNRMKNSIPLLVLSTNNYSFLNVGHIKNKEYFNSYNKYKEKNKKLADMIAEAFGNC